LVIFSHRPALPFSGLVTLKVMYIAQTDGRVQEEGPWFLTSVL
jgi:hypothetical protein